MNSVLPSGKPPRVLGRSGSNSGPRVVVTAGLHGNEPAGVAAAGRVLEKLASLNVPLDGRLLALAGNRVALERRCRFVDEDLNRIWTTDRLEAALGGENGRTVEERELGDLLAEIGAVLSGTRDRVVFLDLHTTSAPGAPFSIFADTLANRRLALRLPGPMVLGLEEHLHGTFLNFINGLGHVAVGFEGGAHDDPASIDTHELAIWRTLLATGSLRREHCPDLSQLSAAVDARARAWPRVVEIRSRHVVEPDARFVMEPGFENLRRIRRGELLARDRQGEIRASESGRILMPLYQNQGSDGFFVVREVRWFWLGVSAWLRRMGADRAAPYLPGVRPLSPSGETLLVEGAARGLIVRLFHLLGYRRIASAGDELVFRRRREVPLRDLGPHLQVDRK